MSQVFATAQVSQAPPVNASFGGGMLQRQCACGQHTGAGGECEGCAKTRQTLARYALSAGNPNSFAVPSIVHDVLRSPGQPLDQPTQAFFSPRFAHDFSRIRTHAASPALNTSGMTVSSPGDVSEREADEVAERVLRRTEPTCRGGTPWLPPIVEERGVATECHSYNGDGAGGDLSNVRIHADARAAESARAVNARAYTVGRDVVFGQSEYRPQSSEGRKLLAHELAHVFQQSAEANGPQIQREVSEQNFPGGGHVDEEQTGQHRIWNFDVGNAVLKPEHLTGIKKLAKDIKDSLSPGDEEEQVDLEGQASSTGTAQSNEALASRRAQAVKQALVKEGVPESKIRVTVVGEAKSEVGTTQENFARSRAVRLLFFPKAKLTPPASPPTQTGCRPGLANGNDLALDLEATEKVGLRLETAPQGQFIVLRAGTTTTPGMTIQAAPFMTPPNCGVLSFVQNVMTFRQIIYKDGSRNTMQTNGFVLDKGDPYPCNPPTPPDIFFSAVDGPSFGVNPRQQPRISTIEVRDEFRTFLMFQPKGGTRRTHQVAEWGWAGQARNNTPEQDKGQLELQTGISRSRPQVGKGFFTATAPVLSPNIADTRFVTDTSANPSPDSDAAKLVNGLNAGRGQTKPGTVCGQKPAPPPSPGTNKEKAAGESG